jgi:hypothetical protein
MANPVQTIIEIIMMNWPLMILLFLLTLLKIFGPSHDTHNFVLVVDNPGYDKVIEIFKKNNLNAQDYNADLSEIRKHFVAALAKGEEPLIRKCVDVIDKKNVEPYKVTEVWQLDANFLFFFLSKGEVKKFFLANEEASTVNENPLIRAPAEWACRSIQTQNKEFFSQ